MGSSSTRYLGRMARMPARAARRFSPPDSSKGDFSANWSILSPTMDMASLTRIEISSSLSFMFWGPKATSSRTVSAKSWYSGYWNTMPTRDRMRGRSFLSAVSSPSTSTRPALGSSRPLRCWTNVVLPQPVWPMRDKNSPSRISRETSFTAVLDVTPSK